MPTRRDRAMQALSRLGLAPMAETLADPNSDGFRTQRAPAAAIAPCCTVLVKKAWPPGVFEGDRRACFDALSHDWLLAHIPMDQAGWPKWRKAGYSAGNVLHPTEAGTPQGGLCSPVIATLAWEGLEARLRTAVPRYVWHGPTQVCPTVTCSRLADDFVITGATKELLEDAVTPLVEAFWKERGLHLSPEQTGLTPMAEGLDVRGQHRRKDTGKRLIKPSAKRIKTVWRNVRGVMKAHKSAAAGVSSAK
jgi:RNA-directed DNA polymerase